MSSTPWLWVRSVSYMLAHGCLAVPQLTGSVSMMMRLAMVKCLLDWQVMRMLWMVNYGEGPNGCIYLRRRLRI